MYVDQGSTRSKMEWDVLPRYSLCALHAINVNVAIYLLWTSMCSAVFVLLDALYRVDAKCHHPRNDLPFDCLQRIHQN
jgi:hypothetical protein